MPPVIVRDAGGFFSLLDERLKLGTEGYSPCVLAKIEYAGGNSTSFRVAQESLERLGELQIGARHIERVSERVGAERAQARDQQAARMGAGQLPPEHKEPPAMAVVQVDAGKCQFRRDKGKPPPEASANDPRKIVARTHAFVAANRDRMDYPRYRTLGLPVASALVESLIKQLNFRIKGTEKFWLEPGAESILQIRAAYLSQDHSPEEFYACRPRGRAVGQGRRKAA